MRRLLYLGQNVLSDLLPGGPLREALLRLISDLRRERFTPVWSNAHFTEIHAGEASRPYLDGFTAVLREIGAEALVTPLEQDDPRPSAPETVAGDPGDLLGQPDDPGTLAANGIQKPVLLMQFLAGGLPELGPDALLAFAKAELQADLAQLFADISQADSPAVTAWITAKTGILDDFQIAQQHEELEAGIRPWKNAIGNRGWIDALPAADVVPALFSKCPEPDRPQVEDQFPRNFWIDGTTDRTGGITGFAHLLFHMEAVSTAGTRKGDLARRIARYRGQFRDALHIEAAADCDLLLTSDNGMRRLAEIVAAWSGARIHPLTPVSG